MFPDAQAEMSKANWAMGLGIGSFFCCVTSIPGLIIGWPLMKKAQNPEARSRAKVGVILCIIALVIALLSLLATVPLMVAAAAADAASPSFEDIQMMEKQMREAVESIKK
jgi:hypothetical protein